jgi:hypothetical protein
MNPVSLSLDLLLMVLLVAALGFGWRLERRLKALRESHTDFAGAIADLDRAAQRAEIGLAQLRQATDEAVDLLAGRIEKARELSAKLDKQVHQAATIQPRPANDTHRPALAPSPGVRPAPAPIASPVDAVLAAESLARRLAGDDSLVLRQPAPAERPRVAAPAPRALQRPRPSLDDDLFEAPSRQAQAGLARRR